MPTDKEIDAALNAWHPDVARAATYMGGWSQDAKDQMLRALTAAEQVRASEPGFTPDDIAELKRLAADHRVSSELIGMRIRNTVLHD